MSPILLISIKFCSLWYHALNGILKTLVQTRCDELSPYFLKAVRCTVFWLHKVSATRTFCLMSTRRHDFKRQISPMLHRRLRNSGRSSLYLSTMTALSRDLPYKLFVMNADQSHTSCVAGCSEFRFIGNENNKIEGDTRLRMSARTVFSFDRLQRKMRFFA